MTDNNSSDSSQKKTEDIDPDSIAKEDEFEKIGDSDSDSDLGSEAQKKFEESARAHCQETLDRIEWFIKEMDTTAPRKANGALILAQLIRPTAPISYLLWSLLIIISICLPVGLDGLIHGVFWGVYTAVLCLFLAGIVTFFLFWRALEGAKQIWLLKHGRAALGHFVQFEEVRVPLRRNAQRLMYAYRANNNMIYCVRFIDFKSERFAAISGATVFYDPNYPNEGTIYENMFGQVTYCVKTKSFTQNKWYWLSLLYPFLAIAAFTVSAVCLRFGLFTLQ